VDPTEVNRLAVGQTVGQPAHTVANGASARIKPWSDQEPSRRTTRLRTPDYGNEWANRSRCWLRQPGRRSATVASAPPGVLRLGFEPLLESREVGRHLLASLPADDKWHEKPADAAAFEVNGDGQAG
jgi:hypothetical protein